MNEFLNFILDNEEEFWHHLKCPIGKEINMGDIIVALRKMDKLYYDEKLYEIKHWK